MDDVLVDSTKVTLGQHGLPIIITRVHFVALKMTLGQLVFPFDVAANECVMMSHPPTLHYRTTVKC